MLSGKMREKLTASVGSTKLQGERDEYGSVYFDDESVEVPLSDRESLWQAVGALTDGSDVPLYVERGEGEHEYIVYVRGEVVHVDLETDRDLRLKNLRKSAQGGKSASQLVRAPMPGLLKSILVEEGQTVTKGMALCILEAMKMENEIKSPGEFVVKRVFTEPGKAVEKAAPLVELIASEQGEA